MLLKTLFCGLISAVIATLLWCSQVSARMGLLNNCDFVINMVQLSPGSFRFYSDWPDPPSWITYKGESISSHPATRHFWLFLQVQVDGIDEAMARAAVLRQDLEALSCDPGAHTDPDLRASLVEGLLTDLYRDVREKGGYFEILVGYDPEAPCPNPTATFQVAYAQAVFFYLLVVYNLEICGATDLIWSDFQVAVTLACFTAYADVGRVVLEWTTQSERQNLGFDLLRRDSFSPTFVKINEQLIPAAGGGDSEIPLHYRFMDDHVCGGATYEYQLEDVNFRGERTLQATVSVILSASGTTPGNVRLFHNYPNPFNASTEIRYQTPREAHVTLSIYDVRGELVKVLLDGFQSQGEYLARWDGRTLGGHAASSGLYFCALQVGDHREVMKMVLLR